MSNTYFKLTKHKFDQDPFSNRLDKGLLVVNILNNEKTICDL